MDESGFEKLYEKTGSSRSNLRPCWKHFSESFELVAAPFLISFLCGGIVCLLLAYKWLEPSKNK
jgi:type VI protein secretion system component VasF